MKNTLVILLFVCLSTLSQAAVFNVKNYGAVDNGKVLTTQHIQKAIDACGRAGGGQVYVPKGEYLIGTLSLRSNVEFHLEMGAVLIATTDLTQYKKDNDELAGVFFTENASNVALTGKGRIFGQGMEFMHKDSPKVLTGDILGYTRQKDNYRKADGIADGPIVDKPRFHQMIIFSNCTDVVLSDFECVDAPFWTILIVHCNRVKVSNLTIDNNLIIPNSDGLDIVSSSNVNVSDCIITCGDDAMILTGYAQHYGDPGYKNIIRPSKNINVTNCILKSRSSGIRIGCWDQNHMENYNISNVTIYDSNCGINITVRDSGYVHNMNFSNIRIETRLHTGDWWGNGEPIKITAMRGVPDSPIGTVKNLNFNNITCRGENAILLYASDESKIENVTFNNFNFVLAKSKLENVMGGNFDLRPNTVKGKELFKSDVPVVHIENAENVYFNQGHIGWDGVEASHYTHAIKAIKVNNLKLNNMTVEESPSNPSLPPIGLTECTKVCQTNVE